MRYFIIIVLCGVFLQSCAPLADNDPEGLPTQLRKAIERGDANAQYNLGERYYLGAGKYTRKYTSSSVPRNYAEAAKWFRKAAEQGHAGAQYNLGVSYNKGQGVPYHYAEAAKWFQKAAEQGHAHAQYNLGVHYAKGKGVPQNYIHAYAWCNLATTHEDDPSLESNVEKCIRDLERFRMTPAQISEGKALSQRILKRISRNN